MAPGSRQLSEGLDVISPTFGTEFLAASNEPTPITTGEGVMSGELGVRPSAPETGGQVLMGAVARSCATVPVNAGGWLSSSSASRALKSSSTSSGRTGNDGTLRVSSPSSGVTEVPSTTDSSLCPDVDPGIQWGRLLSATRIPQRGYGAANTAARLNYERTMEFFASYRRRVKL